MNAFGGFVVLFVYLQLTLTGSDLQQCEERGTCKFNRVITVPSCYCDEECIYYMDCCKEYVVDRVIDNQTQNVSAHQSCVLITDPKSVVSERVGVFMVDSCEDSGIPCKVTEDLISRIPVSNSMNVYLNKECAFCNGVHEFRFWKAIYSVANDNDIFKLSRNGLSNNNVLAFLRNESSTGLEFRPPLEFRPRFCPYDILRMGQGELRGTNMLYQNSVLCSDKFFFKNADACVKDGCCNSTSNIWCIEYDLNLHDDNEEVRGGIDSIQVVIDFDEHETQSLSLREHSEINDENVLYQKMVVHMITEVYVRPNTTSIYFDDCVQGLLLHLSSIDFKLETLYPVYTTGYTGNDTYVVLHHLQSQTSLNVAQIEELFRVEFYFTCEDTELDMTIEGHTKVFEADYVSLYFYYIDSSFHQSIHQVQIKSQQYMITSPNIGNICSNMLLKLRKHEAVTEVRVKCAGETELNVNQNGGGMLDKPDIITFTLLLIISLFTDF